MLADQMPAGYAELIAATLEQAFEPGELECAVIDDVPSVRPARGIEELWLHITACGEGLDLPIMTTEYPPSFWWTSGKGFVMKFNAGSRRVDSVGDGGD